MLTRWQDGVRDENFSHVSVVLVRMNFRDVVCEIALARAPCDVNLALADAISYPQETHVHGRGAFLFLCLAGYANCAFVVAFDLCRAVLRIA